MPTQHLVDLARLDLSNVLVTGAQTRELLKQTGRFAMLDGILHRDVDANLIVGFKDVRADDWWAADHIPGRPLFPGVLMVEAAAQLCSYDYLLRHEGDDKPFIGFGGIDRARFRGVVEPDVRMILAGAMKRVRSSMFIYEAQGFVDGELVFETEVRGVVL